MEDLQLLNAVRYFKELPHQIDAWKWLDKNLTPEQRKEFTLRYRKETEQSKTTTSILNSWQGVCNIAKQAGAKYPEVVAAQWALESGWGKHTSGKNNFFGLKGSGSNVNTQEFLNGQWVTIKAGFIDFPDIKTCVYYLVDRWYKDFGRFSGVNRASNRNECARLLVKEGYATDPDYATKLIKIMNQQLQASGETPKLQEITHEQKFIPSSPFTYKITPHITYGEFTLNEEARRFTKQYQCNTAIELCRFLERVRSAFGNKPLIITSGHRPPAVNAAVGGASNSEHLFSNETTGAVDFYIEGASIYDVQDWCDKNWPYSVGYGADRGFVHLGMRLGKPRVRWDY